MRPYGLQGREWSHRARYLPFERRKREFGSRGPFPCQRTSISTTCGASKSGRTPQRPQDVVRHTNLCGPSRWPLLLFLSHWRCRQSFYTEKKSKHEKHLFALESSWKCRRLRRSQIPLLLQGSYQQCKRLLRWFTLEQENYFRPLRDTGLVGNL